jgi:hypothetical protein
MPLRTDVQVEIQGLATGFYEIKAYDTWKGVYIDMDNSSDAEIITQCKAGESCTIALPDFTSDMAFKIIRK